MKIRFIEIHEQLQGINEIFSEFNLNEISLKCFPGITETLYSLLSKRTNKLQTLRIDLYDSPEEINESILETIAHFDNVENLVLEWFELYDKMDKLMLLLNSKSLSSLTLDCPRMELESFEFIEKALGGHIENLRKISFRARRFNNNFFMNF